ncbi:MAG: Bll4978 protein [uncultured Sphingomonadaceae bacterium]|uniref:Bll4978 protein n=1 Tax=uncultured Sphingomonadaceae bacterium TaxID=169976 RepID=A0A6J4S4K4_9SPHN|nr:MAG: Bll4978 protein [uncultured Sphingomonadaceae bacterium]
MPKDAELDLVVHGATGFTGRLVAEHLVRRHPDLRWAMSGRSAAKLAAVRDEVGAPADLPLIVADAADKASLTALVARTKAVITTVGPYQLYGAPLVAACAAAGTDYLDLCGEPAWMRAMIDAHNDTAKASGARILFSCGFDSIPFELGVLFLQREAARAFGRPFPRIKGRVRAFRGSFSGGTLASLGATLAAAVRDREVVRLLKDPFSLTPGFAGPPQPEEQGVLLDEELGSWSAPFVMAAINTRNVHRSNLLQGQPWGADFVYDERMLTGPGEKGRATAEGVAGAPSPLADPSAPKPGEGPSREEREAGFYEVLFVGSTPDGRSMTALVKGDRDPGYGSTSKLIAETALCLAAEGANVAGGVLTPGAALGDALVRRLSERAGLSFELLG